MFRAADWGCSCWVEELDGVGMSAGRMRVLGVSKSDGSMSEWSMSEGSESDPETSSMRAC